MMTSQKNEAERLLDHAIGLLVMPTLENLGRVETALREAVGQLSEPGCGGAAVAGKVRLCGRLLEAAEAARPGCGAWGGGWGGAYDARGERPRLVTNRFVLDA